MSDSTTTPISREDVARRLAEHIYQQRARRRAEGWPTTVIDHGSPEPEDVDGITAWLLAGDLKISWLDPTVEAGMHMLHGPATGDATFLVEPL